MSLMKRFYTDRYLHIRTFAISLAISAGLCAALIAIRPPEFYAFHFAWWHLALIPLGVYIGGISAVFIHNASHDSFPNPALNWICGQIAGIHQLWGFMGWKLIHLVHHQYSDNVDMDPHPPRGLNFYDFTRTMFLHSSAKITERYREHWGESNHTHLLHRSLLVIFLGMVAANTLLWYLLLGPEGFLFFYVPSYIANHLLFAHINYYAHPLDEESKENRPGNMDNNLYYKLANFFWCGIYYHENHHRRPKLFNPKYMPVNERRREQAEDEKIAA